MNGSKIDGEVFGEWIYRKVHGEVVPVPYEAKMISTVLSNEKTASERGRQTIKRNRAVFADSPAFCDVVKDADLFGYDGVSSLRRDYFLRYEIRDFRGYGVFTWFGELALQRNGAGNNKLLTLHVD